MKGEVLLGFLALLPDERDDAGGTWLGQGRTGRVKETRCRCPRALEADPNLQTGGVPKFKELAAKGLLCERKAEAPNRGKAM